MSTYLFTWNPKKWNWDDRDNLIQLLPNQKPMRKWATISTQHIGKGDKFILLKIGSIPKEEKGIIGIGSIISAPFKDKDFLREDKIRDFINLEFDYLDEKPFIYLEELENKYPNQKWTPESSGILIKEINIANEIFTRINSLNRSSIQKFSPLNLNIFFPVIAEEIDLALLQNTSIQEDEIIQILLSKYQITLEKLAKNSGKSISSIAEDMVNYFSKELLKNSEIVSEWYDKYKIKQSNAGRNSSYSLALNPFQDEIISNDIVYKEGSVKQVTTNAYERNPDARKRCLKHWKYKCQCCGFDFEKTYGEVGKDFIHVHHKKPLSEIREEYELDPVNDLIPVCANCHAMIHRKIPAYEIEEIKFFLEQNKSKEL